VLTADLVRAAVRQGVLRPRWVEPADPELRAGAAALIEVFRAHIGRQLGALDDAITEITMTRADPLLWGGLVKLLHDRATTATRAAAPPPAIRAAVFAEAGTRWPIRPETRAEALAAAALALGIDLAAVEGGLHADRVDEQWLEAIEAPTPEALLSDYNLALAQAALLRARRVRVELVGLEAKRARVVLRELKFRRLLATVEPIASEDDDARGWRLEIDGPLSLFKQTSRYGLQLALFLPALARCPRWRLEADVAWGKGGAAPRDVTLALSHESPLAPTGHHGDRGTWIAAEEEHFVRAWEALDTPWRLEPSARLVDLDGRELLAPDYVVRHPDGREALVDLVWAWRKKGFGARLELLRAAAPPNLIVLVAERGVLDEGAAGAERAPDRPAVLAFKGVISPRKVLALAEQVAITPAPEAGGKASARSPGQPGEAEPSGQLTRPRARTKGARAAPDKAGSGSKSRESR